MPEAPNLIQAAANLERKRLTSLINSMADGVIAIDSNNKVVIYNGAALNILNVNSTITNKPITEVLKLTNKQSQPINTLDLIRSAKTAYSTRDLAMNYPDGSTIKLYLSIAPVHLGYGGDGARGYVLLMRDITREKSLEEERDEFISVASHELRTPVAIAEGNISNARLITQKSGDLKQIDNALAQAYEQIIFLSSLINDLATLSRAESDKLQVSIEDINAHDLIQELATSYESEMKTKGLTLITEIDPRLEMLTSSKLYVKEILQNFITNAIKYTETGQITIGAQPNPSGSGVDFWVQDTGIGISRSDQEKVFNKFFRSEDFRTRKSKGTGLGLYVTRKLINLLNGKVTLQSDLNVGSKFTVYIPNLAVTIQH